MCTEYLNEGEIKTTDSDKTLTMMASQKFYSILQEIQSSHLNFQLQLSSFSALISLKKSFVREKDGSVSFPPHLCDKVSEADISDYKGRNEKLVKELDTLRCKFKDVVDDCASKTIPTLGLMYFLPGGLEIEQGNTLLYPHSKPGRDITLLRVGMSKTEEFTCYQEQYRGFGRKNCEN